MPYRLVLLLLLIGVLPAAQLKARQSVQPAFAAALRDVQIMRADDGSWYATGTRANEANPTDFNNNAGIEIWHSQDLETWRSLGLVWSIADHATSPASAWQQEQGVDASGRLMRAITAPEIHQIGERFVLCYSINEQGVGLLVADQAAGPYTDLGPIVRQGGGSGSLFVDDDGRIYLLWGAGWIAALRPDLGGLDSEPINLVSTMHTTEPFSFLRSFFQTAGLGGFSLTKVDGVYQLTMATWINRLGDPCHDSLIAVADSPTGPYERALLFVNHSGQTSIFERADGSYAASCWGADERANFQNRPAWLPLAWDKRTRSLIRPQADWYTEAGDWETVMPTKARFGADPEMLYAPDGYYYYTASAIIRGKLVLYRATDIDGAWEEIVVTTGAEVVADPRWPAEPNPEKSRHKGEDPSRNNFWEGSFMWHQDRLYITAGLLRLNSSPGHHKNGLGLWRSQPGSGAGPYEFVARIAGNDGVSLFSDGDTAYLCTGFGLLRRFLPDMTALDPDFDYRLRWTQGYQVNYDCGWFLYKIGHKYVAQTVYIHGSYVSAYGVADDITGPYAFVGYSHPHGGNSMLFQTRTGDWMQCGFGNTDLFVPLNHQSTWPIPMRVETVDDRLVIEPAYLSHRKP